VADGTKVETDAPGSRSPEVAAQQLSACDWVIGLGVCVFADPDGGIGQASSCVQQSSRASGVSPPAQAARFPTHNINTASSDARRLTKVSTPVGCCTDPLVSNRPSQTLRVMPESWRFKKGASRQLSRHPRHFPWFLTPPATPKRGACECSPVRVPETRHQVGTPAHTVATTAEDVSAPIQGATVIHTRSANSFTPKSSTDGRRRVRCRRRMRPASRASCVTIAPTAPAAPWTTLCPA